MTRNYAYFVFMSHKCNRKTNRCANSWQVRLLSASMCTDACGLYELLHIEASVNAWAIFLYQLCFFKSVFTGY